MKLQHRPVTNPILVLNESGKSFTTSRIIAEVFSKEHKEVLRDIRELLQALEAVSGNGWDFALVDYEDLKGQKRPMYELNRDAFSLLVMGFTGEKALHWKVKFVAAFNAMEEELKKQRVIIQDNPFNLELLALGLLQMGPEQRRTAKQIRCHWTNIVQNSIGCGNTWLRRLTNEVYQILLDNPDARARNFRDHMNLPLISALYLTRDQLEGHVQSFVTDIELSAIRLYSVNRDVTLKEFRKFMHQQAKMYREQLLRIVQQPPSELVFGHEYNIVPILPYRERRMQQSQAI